MANKFWPATALTGGADGALDAIDGAELTVGDAAMVVIAGQAHFYQVMASAVAEHSPLLIKPDANDNGLRWLRIPLHNHFNSCARIVDSPAPGHVTTSISQIFWGGKLLLDGVGNTVSVVVPKPDPLAPEEKQRFFIERLGLLTVGADEGITAFPALSFRASISTDPGSGFTIANNLHLTNKMISSFSDDTGTIHTAPSGAAISTASTLGGYYWIVNCVVVTAALFNGSVPYCYPFVIGHYAILP